MGVQENIFPIMFSSGCCSTKSHANAGEVLLSRPVMNANRNVKQLASQSEAQAQYCTEMWNHTAPLTATFKIQTRCVGRTLNRSVTNRLAKPYSRLQRNSQPALTAGNLKIFCLSTKFSKS